MIHIVLFSIMCSLSNPTDKGLFDVRRKYRGMGPSPMGGQTRGKWKQAYPGRSYGIMSGKNF